MPIGQLRYKLIDYYSKKAFKQISIKTGLKASTNRCIRLLVSLGIQSECSIPDNLIKYDAHIHLTKCRRGGKQNQKLLRVKKLYLVFSK